VERTSEDKRLSTFVFYGALVLVTYLAWLVVKPFVMEVAWAVVLAITLDPLRARLEPRLGRTRTAIGVTAAVLVLIIVPALVVGYVVLQEGGAAAAYVQTQVASQGGAAGVFHRFWEWARLHIPQLPDEAAVSARIGSKLFTVAEVVGSQTGSILASVGRLVLSLTIILMLLFFLVLDASSFADSVRRVLPFGRERNQKIVHSASGLISTSITSTLLIAVIQGIIGGITFALLGVPGATVWGVMIGFFALLPVAGAAIVWAPAAVWLALTGHLVQGVVIAAVGVLILGNVDNVVRPLVLSGKSSVSTPVMGISLLGGVAAFGFIGIVLGPLVAAILTSIVGSYAKEVDVAPREVGG
jgi:predicted PurR-regulated permease PerM